MLRWAASISRRPIPTGVEPPPLIPMKGDSLARLVCSDNPQNCSRLAASYSIKTGEIMYRASFDLRNIVHRSFVVHEMVHFLQHLRQHDKITETCHQILKNEREGYAAQAAYLRRHGSIYASQVFPLMASCDADGDDEITLE